jgi:hypothetical protein
MLIIPGFGPGTISGGKWSDDIGLYDIERVPDRSPLRCLIQSYAHDQIAYFSAIGVVSLCHKVIVPHMAMSPALRHDASVENVMYGKEGRGG